jgi:hypothetical protein
MDLPPLISRSKDENQSPKKARGSAVPRCGNDFDMEAFLATIQGEHFSTNQLVERATKFSGLSERTTYSKLLPHLKRRLAYDSKFKTYSVSLFSGV